MFFNFWQWRTSQSTFFENNETATARALEARALQLTGFPIIEGLQVVRYEKTQQYKYHFDWFRNDKGQGRAIHTSGQRVVTMCAVCCPFAPSCLVRFDADSMMLHSFAYLNDVPIGDGGETGFWNLMNLKIRPRKHSAVFW